MSLETLQGLRAWMLNMSVVRVFGTVERVI